jgi:uncharacterized protein (DUF2267 family)
VIFTLLLRRRLGGSGRTHVIRTHVRLVFAALIAAIPIELITHLISQDRQDTPLGAFVTLLLAGGAGVIVFALVARRLRIGEIDQLRRMLPGRFRAAG